MHLTGQDPNNLMSNIICIFCVCLSACLLEPCTPHSAINFTFVDIMVLISFKSPKKWTHKKGKLQEPPTRNYLVNTLYRLKTTAHMTPRFLTKVNTYISGDKHGRFILNHTLLSENKSSRS